MSILIKGLKMPESCSACQFLEGDSMDGLCHAANRWLDDDEFFTWYVYAEGDVDTSKPCNCPLIELPDHGRLIDADKIEYYEVIRFGEPHYMVWKPHIDDLPTILEAERSEE